jgi:hypothetical protein
MALQLRLRLHLLLAPEVPTSPPTGRASCLSGPTTSLNDVLDHVVEREHYVHGPDVPQLSALNYKSRCNPDCSLARQSRAEYIGSVGSNPGDRNRSERSIHIAGKTKHCARLIRRTYRILAFKARRRRSR